MSKGKKARNKRRTNGTNAASPEPPVPPFDHRQSILKVGWPIVAVLVGLAASLSGAKNQPVVDVLIGISAAWTGWVILTSNILVKVHGVRRAAVTICTIAVLIGAWWWVARRILRPDTSELRPLTAAIEQLDDTLRKTDAHRNVIIAGDTRAVRFKDVPITHPAWPFISALVRNRVSAGCSDKLELFCPDSLVTRAEQAIMLMRAREGSDFAPQPCTAPRFSDVPCSFWCASWINELARRGIATDCGGGRYCPDTTVSRVEMAVAALRAEEGAGFTPPECTTPTFRDVPCSHPSSPWIEELVNRGLPIKYVGSSFQPDKQATRADAAVFLVTAFHLPQP